MSQYTLSDRELSIMKGKLTRLRGLLRKSREEKDPEKIEGVVRDIEDEVSRATSVFEEKGYPDCWMDWERLLDDARTELLIGRKW